MYCYLELHMGGALHHSLMFALNFCYRIYKIYSDLSVSGESHVKMLVGSATELHLPLS